MARKRVAIVLAVGSLLLFVAGVHRWNMVISLAYDDRVAYAGDDSARSMGQLYRTLLALRPSWREGVKQLQAVANDIRTKQRVDFWAGTATPTEQPDYVTSLARAMPDYDAALQKAQANVTTDAAQFEGDTERRLVSEMVTFVFYQAQRFYGCSLVHGGPDPRDMRWGREQIALMRRARQHDGHVDPYLDRLVKSAGPYREQLCSANLLLKPVHEAFPDRFSCGTGFASVQDSLRSQALLQTADTDLYQGRLFEARAIYQQVQDGSRARQLDWTLAIMSAGCLTLAAALKFWLSTSRTR